MHYYFKLCGEMCKLFFSLFALSKKLCRSLNNNASNIVFFLNDCYILVKYIVSLRDECVENTNRSLK